MLRLADVKFKLIYLINFRLILVYSSNIILETVFVTLHSGVLLEISPTLMLYKPNPNLTKSQVKTKVKVQA